MILSTLETSLSTLSIVYGVPRLYLPHSKDEILTALKRKRKEERKERKEERRKQREEEEKENKKKKQNKYQQQKKKKNQNKKKYQKESSEEETEEEDSSSSSSGEESSNSSSLRLPRHLRRRQRRSHRFQLLLQENKAHGTVDSSYDSSISSSSSAALPSSTSSSSESSNDQHRSTALATAISTTATTAAAVSYSCNHSLPSAEATRPEVKQEANSDDFKASKTKNAPQQQSQTQKTTTVSPKGSPKQRSILSLRPTSSSSCPAFHSHNNSNGYPHYTSVFEQSLSIVVLSNDFVVLHPQNTTFALRTSLAADQPGSFNYTVFDCKCNVEDIKLSTDSIRLMQMPNAGGNSLHSELMSFEVLQRT